MQSIASRIDRVLKPILVTAFGSLVTAALIFNHKWAPPPEAEPVADPVAEPVAEPKPLPTTGEEWHTFYTDILKDPKLLLQYPNLPLSAKAYLTGCNIEIFKDYFAKDASKELCMQIVLKSPHLLEAIENQTEELCRAALHSLGHRQARGETSRSTYDILAMMRIDRTPAILEYANYIDGCGLAFMDEQPAELCASIVQQFPKALKYVKQQTPAMCLAAVLQAPHVLQDVREQTHEICMAAIQQDGSYLEHVKIPKTREMILTALATNPHSIRLVEEQTEEYNLIAVRNNHNALYYIRMNRTDLLIDTALERYPGILSMLMPSEQTMERCLRAVRAKPGVITCVLDQTPEICLEAVKREGYTLAFVQHKTLEICRAALEQSPEAWKFVPAELRPALQHLLGPAFPPTEFEELPVAVAAVTDYTDPMTFEPPVKGGVYGWLVEGGKWYLAGSLLTFQDFVQRRYRESTGRMLFVLHKNALVPARELRWAKW